MRRAMVVAEESKALLLAEALNRRQIPAPAGLEESLVDEERALLATVSALDEQEFLRTGTPQESEEATGMDPFATRGSCSRG